MPGNALFPVGQPSDTPTLLRTGCGIISAPWHPPSHTAWNTPLLLHLLHANTKQRQPLSHSLPSRVWSCDKPFDTPSTLLRVTHLEQKTPNAFVQTTNLQVDADRYLAARRTQNSSNSLWHKPCATAPLVYTFTRLEGKKASVMSILITRYCRYRRKTHGSRWKQEHMATTVAMPSLTILPAMNTTRDIGWCFVGLPALRPGP